MSEHLVRLHIPLAEAMTTGDEFDRYSDFEDRLDEAAKEAGVGYLDGNEVGGGEYTIWLYGASAQPLADIVRDMVAKENLPTGCTLFVRHGGTSQADALEETLSLT